MILLHGVSQLDSDSVSQVINPNKNFQNF